MYAVAEKLTDDTSKILSMHRLYARAEKRYYQERNLSANPNSIIVITAVMHRNFVGQEVRKTHNLAGGSYGA